MTKSDIPKPEGMTARSRSVCPDQPFQSYGTLIIVTWLPVGL